MKLSIEKCPRCGSAWIKAKSAVQSDSEFWYRCSNTKCNTYYNSYRPQAHQASFHRDAHRFTANFGGYGSGKTLTTREELYKHVFLTPHGNMLVGANVMSQYEQTLKRELLSDIPAAFINKINTQKDYIDLINGYRIIFRPFDDPDKLRSYNIDMFVILEASEVKSSSYTQLKTRLRNMNAAVREGDTTLADWRRGIIESNPDSGWIRDEILFQAKDIYRHGTVLDDFTKLQNPDELDEFTSAHITSTDANRYLPDDFIAQNTKNKPMWWVSKYIYGSFVYSQGTIYPNVNSAVVKPYNIPSDWKRLIAFDYGLNDPSVYLFAAIDEKRGKLVIYKEVVVNETSLKNLADLYFTNTEDIPSGGLISSMLIDPKSGPRRDYEKKSLSDHFLDYKIATRPGYTNKEARILRTNTYIDTGTLEIFDTCPILIREMREYKFQVDEKQPSGFKDKPVDANDHCISTLEWICMDCPADPSKLVYGVYDKMGRDLTKERKINDYRFFPLSDVEDVSRETPYDINMSSDYGYF